jgi:hypothetical protein
MLKISKYKLKSNISQVVFRDASRNLISITNDNITDELVKIATIHGKGHCFEELKEVKKNVSQSAYPSQPVTSILNAVQTVESDLPGVPNKRLDASTEVKKRGRKPKLKE